MVAPRVWILTRSNPVNTSDPWPFSTMLFAKVSRIKVPPRVRDGRSHRPEPKQGLETVYVSAPLLPFFLAAPNGRVAPRILAASLAPRVATFAAPPLSRGRRRRPPPSPRARGGS